MGSVGLKEDLIVKEIKQKENPEGADRQRPEPWTSRAGPAGVKVSGREVAHDQNPGSGPRSIGSVHPWHSLTSKHV